jgi:hypothetical protein
MQVTSSEILNSNSHYPSGKGQKVNRKEPLRCIIWRGQNFLENSPVSVLI